VSSGIGTKSMGRRTEAVMSIVGNEKNNRCIGRMKIYWKKNKY
jgi:hypothetical protein